MKRQGKPKSKTETPSKTGQRKVKDLGPTDAKRVRGGATSDFQFVQRSTKSTPTL